MAIMGLKPDLHLTIMGLKPHPNPTIMGLNLHPNLTDMGMKPAPNEQLVATYFKLTNIFSTYMLQLNNPCKIG